PDLPPTTAETWLTVRATLATDHPWAPAGHEVAWGQFALRPPPADPPPEAPPAQPPLPAEGSPPAPPAQGSPRPPVVGPPLGRVTDPGGGMGPVVHNPAAGPGTPPLTRGAGGVDP